MPSEWPQVCSLPCLSVEVPGPWAHCLISDSLCPGLHTRSYAYRFGSLMVNSASSKVASDIFFLKKKISGQGFSSPRCLGTHYVDQAGFKLRNLPASASQVLELKACATTSRLQGRFLLYSPNLLFNGQWNYLIAQLPLLAKA